METKISQDLKDVLIVDLNEAQFDAVMHDCGPLLIVAGAGTGKTTVITRRIAWFILEKGIKPEDILALTFTDKAAREMEERVDRLLPYGYVELWISTFHAFAEKILRQYAIDIGLPADFKLVDGTAAWLMVRKNLNRFSLNYYRPLGNPTKFIHALLNHFNRAKDELISPLNYLEYVENLKLNNDSEIIIDGENIDQNTRASEIARLEELANAYHVYEQLLLEKKSLDFGSLIFYTIELLKKRPNVLAKLQKQFKYILVDEFQDTNIAQYELVKMLAAPQNNLTVVGDDDQSIYKFRGASISNIIEFKKDFVGAKEIFLTKNYRSCQNILDVSYEFIKQNNPNRLEAKLQNSNFSKKLQSAKIEVGIIDHLHAETAHLEAKKVLEKILELKEKDEESTWNDFAILVRANDHAGIFIRTLDGAQLPYELITARGLYSEPIILDLLSYLRLLDDYHESSALYRILISPVSNLQDKSISNLLYWANRKSLSLFEVMRQASIFDFDANEVFECNRILSLIERHTALTRTGAVRRVIYTILDETNYLKFLTKEDTGANRKSLAALNQLYKQIIKWESDQGTRDFKIRDFLEEIELEMESGEAGKLEVDPNEGPETIKILTCHAAKGLEFKYVFIVNLVDRRFPSAERKEPIELPDALIRETLTEGDIHLEEERRLFYVACTRAKTGLFFTSADDYGGSRKKKPSRFLTELENLNVIKLAAGDFKKTGQELMVENSVVKKIITEPIKNELPSHFSFTQLKAFGACPLQYKFAHILKIPVQGRPTFSFGKTIHRSLQKFCELLRVSQASNQTSFFTTGHETAGKSASLITLDEFYKIYDSMWIDDWYEDDFQKKTYYEKGRKILKLFYEGIERNPPKPIFLEQVFNLKIDNYTIRGVIDRVDELPDKTLEIIDYKTGASKNENRIDKDQLYIYQLALAEVLEGTPSLLTYYYVEDGKRISFLGTSKDLEGLKEKIKVRIEEIKISSFPATPARDKCFHCDFKKICESKIDLLPNTLS